MFNKKGFFGLTLGMIIALVIGIAVLFFGGSIFIWVLGQNLFMVAGAILLIGVAVTYIMGRPIPPRIALYMLIGGVVLVFMPFLFKGLDIPLAIAFGG